MRGRTIGQCWGFEIGVDAGKQLIMDNLRVQSPGAKYCHFPRRDDYGAAYFKGLLSERLVYKEGHKSPWQWEKIPGHERNEALDCRNYAMAAAKALSPDYDAIDRRLRETTAGKETPVATAVNQPKQPTKRRQSTLKKHYDEW